MTKAKIIEETANHYNSENRAVNKGWECVYETHTGERCAVGRCMTEETLTKYKNSCKPVLDLYKETILDNLLKEKYRGHGVYFWEDIQRFHDKSYYWNESGLTGWGERYKQKLIEKYTQ